MIYQARIPIPIVVDKPETYALKFPVYIPNLEDVKLFALQLHQNGDAWHGIFQGWDAEYSPQKRQPMHQSQASFDPAYFVVGDSRIWMYALDWGNGKDAPPSSELNDIRKITEIHIQDTDKIHPSIVA